MPEGKEKKIFSYPLRAKVKKEDLAGIVIFIDTETREEEDERLRDNERRLELMLGCYEVWITDEDGLPEAHIETGYFEEEHEFYQLITKFQRNVRLVCHNWEFDASVLRVGALSNMDKWGYDIDFAKSIIPSDGGAYAPFLIKFRFDKFVVEMIDNTNFYKRKLEDLGEAFGYEKLKMPERDAPFSEWLEYCQRDVMILRLAWFGIFEMSQEIAKITPGITAAMMANRVYRARFFEEDEERKVQGSLQLPSIAAAEKHAYHGGRTDTFFKGMPRTETIYKYDVNSLYPFVMLGKMPIRFRQGIEARSFEHELAAEDVILLSDVTVHIPPESQYGFLGLEGVKRPDDGSLIFPVGRFRTWMWEPLLQIAYEQGYIEKVHQSLGYNARDIFSRYVNHMFELRKVYKSSGNKSMDMLVKLLMNSLYGKFGQRENLPWLLASDEEHDVLKWETRDMKPFTSRWVDLDDYGVPISEPEERDYLWTGSELYVQPVQERNVAQSSVMSIAGYITAKARALLWRSMAMMLDQGAELYMCDTDSIVLDREMPPEVVDGFALGAWKQEEWAVGNECYFYAPKHYIFKNKITKKGFREPEELTQTVFPKFRTTLLSPIEGKRSQLEEGAVIRTVEKWASGVNTKREEVGEGKPTFPWVL